MKINYFSDLHLEFGALETGPENDADVIIAAGDIGILGQGAAWLKALNKPVIYVAGNHEFYSSEYQETISALEQECKGSNNVHFLNNDSVVINGVRFLGSTLWSDLLVDGLDKAGEIGLRLNDFWHINYGQRKFNVDDFNQLHRNSRYWLEQELAKTYSGKTVVVSHHAPSEWSWHESPSALKKIAYCSDLKYLFHQYDIAAWFHGHVHFPSDYRIAGVMVACNPRGYSGKKLVPDFDINKVIEI